MQISRCRYWWCSHCQAVFEKEDLPSKLAQNRSFGDIAAAGTRTCGHCGAQYQLKDVYAGQHDVPRQFWGQLQAPVELPEGASRPTRRRAPPQSESSLSAAMAWLLFLVSVASGLAIVGYVLVRPLLSE
jgi:hypothetical protein